MKPMIFVLISTVLYSVANLVLEQKLSKLSTVSVMFLLYPTFLVLVLAWATHTKLTGQEFVIPTGWLFGFCVLAGVIWFFADYFFIGAYTQGGSLLMITTVFSLFPVVAAILRALYTGSWPTAWHVVAYALAAGAAICAAKGETLLKSVQ